MTCVAIRRIVLIALLIMLATVEWACLKDDDSTLVFPNTHDGPTVRSIQNQGSMTLPGPEIELALWDHQAIDYDIVSVFIDSIRVVNRQLLDGPNNKFTVHITLKHAQNELILFAHNEGANPPNTVALSIKSGSFYEEKSLEANLQTNGSITLIVQQ